MTGAALLAARLLLACVFGLAAAAKLTSRSGLRVTLADFGLPWRMTRIGAIVLPAAELTVTGLLVAAPTARWGALGALVLLAAFCAAIGRLLLRGERPDCGCLGVVRPTPIGRGTLVRNGVLAALAAVVAAAGAGTSLAQIFTALDPSPIAVAVSVLAAAVVALVWFAWQLLRQHGRLLARVRALETDSTLLVDGLPVGAEAPAFEFLSERLDPELPLALVFSNTGCGACEALAPEVERLRDARTDELEIVLVADDRDALGAYRISTVPSATIVDAAGRIAASTVTGTTAVTRLLASFVTPSERLRPATG